MDSKIKINCKGCNKSVSEAEYQSNDKCPKCGSDDITVEMTLRI